MSRVGLRGRRRGRWAALLAGAVLVMTGCSATSDNDTTPSPSPDRASADEAAVVTPAPRPKVGDCHQMTFRQAVAPVAASKDVACGTRHTSQTYHVGKLDLVQDGHRIAVDSPAVQQQVADGCRSRLGKHVGISDRDLRLSMIQPVWFTPSVEQTGLGAAWFRCDVVLLDRAGHLAALPKRTSDIGSSEATRMCGTSAPTNKDFERVSCSNKHAWRAVATVDLPGEDIPDAKKTSDLMSGPCRDAAAAAADNPLDFTWSEERPTRQQWRAGQRYGICWVPNPA